MNSNHFNAMRRFFNTIRAVSAFFDVPRAIARELQHGIGTLKLSEKDCRAIARASTELRSQVGF